MAVSWRVACASVIGSSHVKTESPCQDSHCVHFVRDSTGREFLIAAVSDGAGSATLSGTGSHMTCRAMCAVAAAFIESTGGDNPPTDELVASWAHQSREELSQFAAAAELPIREFACTLIFAIVGESWFTTAQIGDGAMCMPDPDLQDQWCYQFWPHKGEYANTTRFLTDETWHKFFEIASAPRGLDELSLFTDGIEMLALSNADRMVHSPFFNGMFPPIRASKTEGIDPTLSTALSDFLASPRVLARTDDDKTVILASRRATPAPAS